MGASFPLGRSLLAGPIAKIWWLALLQAVGAVVFGGLTIAWPHHTMVALAWLFGVYALLDGLATLAVSARGDGLRSHAWQGLAGAVSAAAGLSALVQPRAMAVIIVGVMGAWLVFRGGAEILAVRPRRFGGHEASPLDRGSALLDGTMTAIVGVVLVLIPHAAALAIMWAIGIWAIVHGLLLVPVALDLRRAGRQTAAPLSGVGEMEGAEQVREAG